MFSFSLKPFKKSDSKRPLPTPGAPASSQRLGMPVLSSPAVPTSSFNRIDHDFTMDGRDDYQATDGRDNYQEPASCNSEECAKVKRCGSGLLAPLLAESVNLCTTRFTRCFLLTSFLLLQYIYLSQGFQASRRANQQVQCLLIPSLSQGSSSLQPDAFNETFTLPSENEVRTSVPHSNAYYCPQDNGWVILIWKSSSVAPTLLQSYLDGNNFPPPDQARRTTSCIDDGGQPFGGSNKTHHFHKYEKAIDSLKLTPSFSQDEWRSLDEDVDQLENEGRLCDLHICCQCSFYVVSSGIIPGVIPRKHIDELVRDKKSGTIQVGKTPEQAVVRAVETFLMALENKLWKGNNRMIHVSGNSFQNKVGWNPNVKQIFELLGFMEEAVGIDTKLKPPPTNITSTVGKQNRRKLLRAWVEFSAWLSDYKRLNVSHSKKLTIHVQLDSAREMYQTAIGACPTQIPRGGLSDSMLDTGRPLDDACANEAFTVLAEARASVKLKKTRKNGENKYMNPEQAYDTLEVPKEVDENVLLTVCNMRLEEIAIQLEKMQEAMAVIAEVRDSEHLRQFVSSGAGL